MFLVVLSFILAIIRFPFSTEEFPGLTLAKHRPKLSLMFAVAGGVH